MRSGLLAFSLLALTACAHPLYDDNDVDAQAPEARNFDVDSSGTATCPGELFRFASYGRATCSHAPQRCVGSQDAAVPVVCSCTGSDSAGSWRCQ
jgi:hypothetical protein